jgi:hypothetical protein
MFTRSSSAEPKPQAPGLGNGAAARGASPSPRVIARGAVSGVIRGAVVGPQASLRVAIVHGTQCDGRCRRAADASRLTAELSS